MNYYFAKKLKSISFEEAIAKVTEALKVEGFGILGLFAHCVEKVKYASNVNYNFTFSDEGKIPCS